MGFFTKSVEAELDELELSSDATSLDLLRAIYRNSSLSLHVRLRAAAIALPHEHPKLSAQQLVHYDGSWADRLDKAVERSERARLVNGNVINEGSRLIEAKVNPPEKVAADNEPGEKVGEKVSPDANGGPGKLSIRRV